LVTSKLQKSNILGHLIRQLGALQEVPCIFF
jgi:hypothetical protein